MVKYKENDFYQPEKFIEAKLKCQNYQRLFQFNDRTYQQIIYFFIEISLESYGSWFLPISDSLGYE